MNKLSIIAAALAVTACASSPVPAPSYTPPYTPEPVQQSDWLSAGSTPTVNFYVRKGSGRFDRDVKGAAVYVAVFQTVDKQTREINSRQKYVTVTDCVRGFGKVVTTDTNGTYRYDNEFVMNGQSIVDVIGTALCEAARQEVSKN